MRRFLTSSPVPGPSRQSQAQEDRTSSRSSLSDASIISDPADPLEDTRSLSRTSSMSTSRLDTLASSSVDMMSASGEETSDHEETQGGGQALNAEEELKGSLHGLNEFFKFYKLESSQKSSKFKDKILHKGMASCCKCPQKIKFDSESRGNLNLKPTTKIEKTSRQITLKEATERPKAWSQELAQQAYVVWFAEGLKPLCDTEDEATRTFLNFLKPEFKMPCRKTLTKRLNKYAVQVKDEVKATLQDVDLVATTADSWTSHRRAFLGCTVHWIDPITLERKAATLACRELMEKQTGRVLARNLSDIFAEFDISKKITHCTTDNWRNYVAAFEHFAADTTTRPELTEEELEEQTDEAIVNSEVVDVSDMLRNRGDDESQLPPHFRCSAHTLNLLATTDVVEVPEWNKGPRAVFRRPGAKAQALWNLQNRSSVYANKIKEALGGRRLVTPVATRWNSYFNSMKALMELVLEKQDAKVAINRILADQGSAGFDMKDAEIIKEYLDVMEPVATCLDRMQSDKWAYMGNLLPDLMLLKKKLQQQQSRNLKHAKKLVDYLLDQDNLTNGFVNR
ncbi:uncharacterized protein LOC143023661 [Oratosquilla oratoria]|uniref:uncharacterized protein LOC143023661 n=1 Tax=Oratosquilla oratoria TaxID=337810 RepID=UPI003F7751D6